MSIPQPVITYPKTDWVAGQENRFYTDITEILISGYIPVTSAIIDNNSIFSLQYKYKIDSVNATGTWSEYAETGIVVGDTLSNVDQIPWSLDTKNVIDVEEGDTVSFEFKSIKRKSTGIDAGSILDDSAVSKLKAVIVSEESIQASAESPTGFRMKKGRDIVKLMVPVDSVVLSANAEFSGCNFYIALSTGGGTAGYVRMNSSLVTEIDASETVEESTKNTIDNTAGNTTVETTITTEKSREYYTFSFTKSVLNSLIIAGDISNVYLSDGFTIPEDQRFYFISTVTAYDTTLSQSVESSYSIELEGKFVYFNEDFKSLPSRSRDDILFDMSGDLTRKNNVISVLQGSVVRDMLDPISLQFEKYYIIQDFVFSTLSVDSLLKFDDNDGDGKSDSIQVNIKKRRLADALGVVDGAALQVLIDEQFDKIASNYDLTRKSSTKSTGTVTFYVNQRPTEDILIPNGSSVIAPADANTGVTKSTFYVRGTKIIDSNNIDFYYNPSTKRYEIEATIEASTAGSRYNVPAGSITIASGLNSLVQVENSLPTQYGTDKENNYDLATRIKLARASYDSGTEGGYASVAYDVSGVLEARIEMAGDPLMMRDYDRESMKHIGGKVDAYIRGNRLLQVLDQVAFRYEYPTDTFGKNVGEIFEVTDASEFRIKTINPKVTFNSPIVLVTQVRNITRGYNYNLNDLQIIGDGDTIVLENNFDNIRIGMATLDVVEVDYRYRSSNTLTLSRQPVRRIVEVTDSNGNIIDSSKYTLIKLEDPLDKGLSSVAKDGVKFLFNETDDIEEFINITDEQHDMLLNTPSRLLNKGVIVSSISVYDPDNTTTIYKKDVDYKVLPGSEVDFTYLELLSNGMIRHGNRVAVDYQANQNFNVTYVTNGLVSDVQDKISKMKHACSDTVCKEAIGNKVDISVRVVRTSGTDISLLKSRIRTSVANYVSRLKMGETLSQGDLINVIQNTKGVRRIVMPLIRMMKRNSSFISLDDLGYLKFESYSRTGGQGVISYRTFSNVLTYKTSENGGDNNLFRGVYEDNVLLQMVDSPLDVSADRGRAYIQADGKIIVSTTDGKPPHQKYYKVSYYTYYEPNENVVEDIQTSQTEHLVVDSLSMKDIEIIDEPVVKRGL